jgi:spermidine synthase
MKPLKRFSQLGRFDPVVVCLSAGSGCAALIYELVWFQLLQLVIGSSATSMGVLLASFMGGMCLGSLLLPRVIKRQHHPLWVYALIEFGIGSMGILILFMMPFVSTLYAANAMQGIPGIFLRTTIAASLLLPPTALMGATLPAISRWTENGPQGVSRLGTIYAANVVGAVFGCLFAGFYLLPFYDTATATYTAAAINGIVALAAAATAAVTFYRSEPHQRVEIAPAQFSGLWPVYAAIALSGLTSLGAEVTWTRLLALLFGATVYTFSVILAVFLLGLSIGTAVGSYLLRNISVPRTALAASQALLVIGIAWSAYMIASALPYWPILPTLAPSRWFNFQIDLFSCAIAILPATLCWGASFPFALAATVPGRDAGRATAAIYAANTVGAIVGALGFSMILIPEFGAYRAEQCLIGISAAAALLMLASPSGSSTPGTPDSPVARIAAIPNAIRIAALPIGAALLIWYVPDIPDMLVAYGRSLLLYQPPQFLYRGDGRINSVAVTQNGSVRSFHVSGKVEASTFLQDMRVQRLLGHLPALLHPKPRSALVVGFGAGVTAGSLVLYPEIERIVICEIEPLIPPNVGPYFSAENYDVLHDPRVTVVYDDARHYLLTTREKFDIITSDSIHPWVKGSAMLYTQEYYELAKQRLNPGGVFTQWAPLYESSPATVKSEIATFFKEFPDGVIWSNYIELKEKVEDYDLILSGQLNPTVTDLDDLSRRLMRPDYDRVRASLSAVKISSLTDLLATYVAQRADLATWLEDAEINTDRSLRLQYLAGLDHNRTQARNIYQTLRNLRWFPPALFTGSRQSMEILNKAINTPPASQ